MTNENVSENAAKKKNNKHTYNNIHQAIAMCHFGKFKFHFI